jgi:hypothetical protein
MKFYKLQVLPNGSSDAARFNANFKPSTIADHNDPYRVEWLGTAANPIGNEEIFIGEKVMCPLKEPPRLPLPDKSVLGSEFRGSSGVFFRRKVADARK